MARFVPLALALIAGAGITVLATFAMHEADESFLAKQTPNNFQSEIWSDEASAREDGCQNPARIAGPSTSPARFGCLRQAD